MGTRVPALANSEDGVARKNLYDDATYEECRARIGHLRADSEPLWGTMSAAQMLAHCAEVQEVSNGKPLVGTPWFIKLFAPLVRRAVVGDRPYARGIKTHPQYRQTTEGNFEAEMGRLLDSLQAFAENRGRAAVPHPLFGEMHEAEKGWASYKHLDHHLEQFGV